MRMMLKVLKSSTGLPRPSQTGREGLEGLHFPTFLCPTALGCRPAASSVGCWVGCTGACPATAQPQAGNAIICPVGFATTVIHIPVRELLPLPHCQVLSLFNFKMPPRPHDYNTIGTDVSRISTLPYALD